MKVQDCDHYVVFGLFSFDEGEPGIGAKSHGILLKI